MLGAFTWTIGMFESSWRKTQLWLCNEYHSLLSVKINVKNVYLWLGYFFLLLRACFGLQCLGYMYDSSCGWLSHNYSMAWYSKQHNTYEYTWIISVIFLYSVMYILISVSCFAWVNCDKFKATSESNQKINK